MCVVSMVYDHYNNRFPYGQGGTGTDWTKVFQNATEPSETDKLVGEMKKLITEFREAVAAAKKVDALTQQPDCSDPEKAKLEERVAALEREIEQLRLGGNMKNKGRR